jgi:hypothetical protein
VIGIVIKEALMSESLFEQILKEYGDLVFPGLWARDPFGVFPAAAVVVRRKDIAEKLVDICMKKGLSLRQSIRLLEGLRVLFDSLDGYLLLGTILYPEPDRIQR